MSKKNPLTPAGIETATFLFVAQQLNRCATAVPVCILYMYERKRLCQDHKIITSFTFHKTFCVCTHFLEWTTLPITVACFVDIMWRQLAQLYPKLPDMFRNTLPGHDISGSFWTVADERVSRSGMHYSTLTHPRSRCVTLTRMSHSVRVNHLHIYRWMLALSANRKCLCVFS